jgi:hypothetical protein
LGGHGGVFLPRILRTRSFAAAAAAPASDANSSPGESCPEPPAAAQSASVACCSHHALCAELSAAAALSAESGNSLLTTIKYLRQTTTAGNRLATTIKYLRGVVGIGLGATIKYRTQCLCVDPELPPCAHKQNPHQNTTPFASAF